MFRIIELTLHGWDYWPPVRIPLESDVILVSGPNGAGKTTLLDAIRQLVGARHLSSRRRPQSYLRNPQRPAIVVAVVTNVEGASGKRPFAHERCFADEVTLACALVPNPSGSPEKRFALLEGNASFEEVRRVLLESKDFLQPERYQRLLELAGVTPSLLRVLGTEQGAMNKVSEWKPRDLLQQVLDMLGDQAVLDNYREAKKQYAAATEEASNQAHALTQLQVQLNEIQRDVGRRKEWSHLKDKVDELAAAVPATQLQEYWIQEKDLTSRPGELKKGLSEAQADRQRVVSQRDSAGKKQTRAKIEADQLRQAEEAARATWSDAGIALARTSEAVCAAAASLERAKSLPVGDLGTLEEAELTASEELAKASIERKEFEDKLLRAKSTLGQLESGVSVYPLEVESTMSALSEARIKYEITARLVEVKDDGLGASVEASLDDARFGLVVAENEIEDTVRIARHHGFPGPIYSGPRIREESSVGSIKISTGAPEWIEDWAKATQIEESGWRDLRGRWVATPSGRFLGRAGLEASLVAAREQLASIEKLVKDFAMRSKVASARLESARAATENQRERIRFLDQAKSIENDRAEAERLSIALRSAQQVHTAALENWREADRIEILAGEERKALEAQVKSVDQTIQGLRSELSHTEEELARIKAHIESLMQTVSEPLQQKAKMQGFRFSSAATQRDLEVATKDLQTFGEPPPESVVEQARLLEGNVRDLELHLKERRLHEERARAEVQACVERYMEVVQATLRDFKRRVESLSRLANARVEVDLPPVGLSPESVDEIGISVRFGFDGKEPMPLGDSDFSGGQHVVAGLVLLMAMAQTEGGGFFLLDEPFAHLSLDRVEQVGQFMHSTASQFLITAPTTIDRGQLDPAAQLVVLRKKVHGEEFAPPPIIGVA